MNRSQRVCIVINSGVVGNALELSVKSSLNSASLSSRSFEILVALDASSPLVVYEKDQDRYPNVRCLRSTSGDGGIAAVLNNAILEVGAPFVSHLRSGDRMYPGRVLSQLDFFEANKTVAVVGSWIELGPFPQMIPLKYPKFMNFRPGCSFASTAVSYRLDAFIQACGYEVEGTRLDDQGLLLRMLTLGSGANIPAFLTSVAVGNFPEESLLTSLDFRKRITADTELKRVSDGKSLSAGMFKMKHRNSVNRLRREVLNEYIDLLSVKRSHDLVKSAFESGRGIVQHDG
jgi:hypothetical protein